MRAMAALAAFPVILWAQGANDFRTPQPMPQGSTLVVGFLGGFENWRDDQRGVRRVAIDLRSMPGVYAETAGNHRQRAAIRMIRRALDTDGNGRLDERERRSARVILYGQSWGGAAAIKTARTLQKWGVPVLLTVQVDSVGLHDGSIPPNVRAAVNFYQHDPLTINGRGQIHAEDPDRTRILGNFRLTYLFRPSDPEASWARRRLGGSHAKMELDPALWAQVERFIVEAINQRQAIR